jgi:hypothetical protein
MISSTNSSLRLGCIPGLSLCECLLDHRINDDKITYQFQWKGIAFAQVGKAIRTHPDLTVRTLPDEDFEGQIEREEWGRDHEWGTPFRIAKDQHVCLLHREAHASSQITMINLGEKGQISLVDGGLQVFQRLLNSERTGPAHNARH